MYSINCEVCAIYVIIRTVYKCYIRPKYKTIFIYLYVYTLLAMLGKFSGGSPMWPS